MITNTSYRGCGGIIPETCRSCTLIGVVAADEARAARFRPCFASRVSLVAQRNAKRHNLPDSGSRVGVNCLKQKECRWRARGRARKVARSGFRGSPLDLTSTVRTTWHRCGVDRTAARGV